MILELDCGNTLIKWRVISSDSGDVVFVGVAANVAELLGFFDRVLFQIEVN